MFLAGRDVDTTAHDNHVEKRKENEFYFSPPIPLEMY